MAAIELWAGSLISNTKNYRWRPASFQHLGVSCQKVSWSAWVMLRSKNCKVADGQAGLGLGASRKEREETGCVPLGGHIKKHNEHVKAPFLAGFSERKQQLNQPVCIPASRGESGPAWIQVLLQCSRMCFLCAIACQVTAMHQSVPVLLGLLPPFLFAFSFLTCFLHANPRLFLQSMQKTKVL